MRIFGRVLVKLAIAGSVTLPTLARDARAGDFFHKRPRAMVETSTTARPQDRVAPSPMLGSFMPSQYVTIRGNGTIGGGYSALDAYGREQSLSVYGPLSAFREIAAPVNTVVRGYNGQPVLVQGTSFSNPNQPTLSPVVYPTRASNYSALRFQTTPPQWDKAIMWIDQN
ncbi:hypothetical protein P12x_001920 [Tundrisphaera lichenicola]|uniref:hypothetical protein n=1 Tax=Tundrisphaera lichenicola TaxID=2029860 RepID=UPI003EBD465C